MEIEEKILYGGITIVIILVIGGLFTGDSAEDRCESKGGVMVGYSRMDCWKDNGYIQY